MKKIYLLILSFICISHSYSQTKDIFNVPYIETSAIADTLVAPDRIHLNIKLSEKDSKGKISTEKLEGMMLNNLKELDIEIEKQLFINDLSSNFKNYLLRKNDILKTKNYNLILFSSDKVGKVILSLESIGISNIDINKIEYSKSDYLKNKMREKAIYKSIIQAKSLLKPLNQKLGKAIYISDLGTSFSDLIINKTTSKRYYAERELREQREYDIEFEMIKIESAVNVKFKIE